MSLHLDFDYHAALISTSTWNTRVEILEDRDQFGGTSTSIGLQNFENNLVLLVEVRHVLFHYRIVIPLGNYSSSFFDPSQYLLQLPFCNHVCLNLIVVMYAWYICTTHVIASCKTYSLSELYLMTSGSSWKVFKKVFNKDIQRWSLHWNKAVDAFRCFLSICQRPKSKIAVHWPKIVKSSVSKNSSNSPKFCETVFRKSSGNRQKAAEFVSTERTLIFRYLVLVHLGKLTLTRTLRSAIPTS